MPSQHVANKYNAAKSSGQMIVQGDEPPPTKATYWKITQIELWPVLREFIAVVQEFDDCGMTGAKIEASSKSLDRLRNIIAPTNATNL